LTQRLGYLFEGFLPGVPIEEMHAVYRRLPEPGKRYLACGLPRAVIEQGVGTEALTLTPASLPEFVGQDVDPTHLNLLSGSFLPEALRKRRRWWLVHVGVILTVCAALLALGLERRTQAARGQIAGRISDKMEIYEEILGPAALQASAGSQPPALRLTAERRRLEQTRRPDTAVVNAVDCSAILAQVLSRWPDDVLTRTEYLSITPTSIIIRAQVPAMADAQRLADAFRGLPGWILKQPRSEAKRKSITVTLRLEPSGQEPSS
jgi:hypothetical protein